MPPGICAFFDADNILKIRQYYSITCTEKNVKSFQVERDIYCFLCPI